MRMSHADVICCARTQIRTVHVRLLYVCTSRTVGVVMRWKHAARQDDTFMTHSIESQYQSITLPVVYVQKPEEGNFAIHSRANPKS
jgi:hypothetical protein